ncbi:MAG: AMP-binding protein, partial [Rhodospirillaceae bacterium]|nr:AMP-binding protein [Rhodospirillaceae bacterium]
MYRFDLTESYIPAQTDDVVLETTVGGILRAAVRERSDATALVEVDERGENHRRWTFAELLADSERLAAALASRYAPGERLVVWAPNVPEWVLMEFACGLAGLVLVTANPSYQKDELRYVLEQSGASALFSVASFRGNPMAEIGAVAAGGLDAVREIVDLDDPDALFRIGERPAALPGVAPGDAAQIQYTSGTTGFPKGAVLSHRALTNNARFFARRTDTRPDSVWANFMPMFHTSGCGMITLGALQAGCPVFLVKQFDPAAVLRLIERERVTAA